MRLTGIVVDGFGVFRAREFRDLQPGLSVLYGPNEAGKSTLLAFIRGVLFGFPRPGRNRRPLYPPLNGGRHGGRAFLETANGRIIIEREVGGRSAVRLEHDSGSLEELSDADFQRLIGGVDDKTFRTIFAFSLDELSDFDVLSGEQVRARIFAAGVGGAGPSVREVIQQMERTCGLLLKPRSREGEINRILAELSEQEQLLQRARARSEGYPALRQELAATKGMLEGLDTREAELRVAQTTHERLLNLWPIWVDMESSRHELSSLEIIDDFVPDAVRRITEAKQRLESARSMAQRLRDQAARRTAEIDEARAQMSDVLWRLTPAVERQTALLPLYQDRRREREVLRTRAAAAADKAAQALRDLGHNLDEQTVADTETSLSRMEEVRAWRSRINEAARQSGQAAERLDLARDQRAKAETERDREQQALEALPHVDPEAHRARMQALRALRAGQAKLRASQAILEGRLSTARAFMTSSASETSSPGSLNWILATAAALTALLLVGAVVFAITGPVAAAAALGSLVAAGVVVCLVVGLGRRARLGGIEGRQEVARQEEAECRALEQEIIRARKELEAPAALLGLAHLDDAEELERIDAALAEEASWTARLTEQAAAARRAAERLKDATQEESLAADRLRRLRDEQIALEHEFRVCMASWGLPETLSYEGVEEYLRGVAIVKDLLARRDEARAQAYQFEADITAWEEETRRLILAAQAAVVPDKALGVDPTKSGLEDEGGTGHGLGVPEVEATLLGLADRCKAEKALRARVAELEKANREHESEVIEADAQVAVCTREWEDLLTQAGARDEEDFFSRLAIYERRQQLRQKIAASEDLLTKSIGRGREADRIRETLAEGCVSQWEDRLRQASEEIEAVRVQRSALLKAEGDIERRLKELEQEADVPALELAIEGLRADLENALERWRIHHLAGLLVKETLAQFTQERQPLVLAEASRMFERVTQGRYLRVQRAVEEEGIVVLERDGKLKSPEQLSRGAAEQLYLCLRLGLAEEFARRAEPMPLVMDDVLVNFDNGRRRATAELLLEFAERHQVLLFTCHEDIVQMISGLSPAAGIITLS